MNLKVKNVDLEKPRSQQVVPGGVYENPLSDAGFKKLLASASSLRSFLNAVMHLDEDREITKLRFKTRRVAFHVSDAVGDEKKIWSFDIRAQTRDGRAIDVEVQNLCHSFFSDRVLIYGAALLLKAKAELDKARADEDERKKSTRNPPKLTNEELSERRRQHYELPETVCVWVCNFAVPSDSVVAWDSWMLYSEDYLKRGKLLPVTDRIKYIFVQLPNFDKNADELETCEDQWSYVLKHAFASKAEIDFKNDAVTEALERLKFSVTDEDSPMMTKEERECIVASIEYEAEKRGEKRGLEAERKRGDAIIANLQAEIAAREMRIRELEGQLAKK